ncbi:fatty acid 2-hydroxylase isoform X1 [Bombus affinis]|uniref:fatty acid 2-hydroxylase isoform X1 n=1 Tax=Bombus affinis TaxID=309941 RepID=UPI0021B84A92|nr:fatty acid 2-hydroxylase isoform X1 [Bombus affinis]XP_050574299.1 fatty acid 2-hydroxylase isoform X1 [Bombus affinis]
MEKTTDSICDVRKRTTESKSELQSTENKQNDDFLINYQNQCYNIQKFLRYHPGGSKILRYFKNRSLEKAFEEFPHSQAAFHLLQDFTLNEEKYQKYENLIDWDKAILGQVGSLGHHYWEWVNLPVYRDIKLFKSNILESLTITPWYLIPIVWIPMSLYFFYNGLARIAAINTESTVFEPLTSFIFGIFIWTMLEYVLHREIFHYKPPDNSKLLITLHFLLHGVHHKAPFDTRRLVFPILPALLVAKLLLMIYNVVFPQTIFYFVLSGTLTGTGIKIFIFIDFIININDVSNVKKICLIGYIFYDLVHYYLHHGAPKFGTYMYLMKRNHNYHHFLHHDLGFGITSKLWDYIFRTNICLRQLLKPIEW